MDRSRLQSVPTLPRGERGWVAGTIAGLEAVAAASADTPMHELELANFPRIRFLLKDETVHPSGSLKHRLARSLLLHALCSGRLRSGQLVIDASSGSTAISEAWFARQLGLDFVAVMPRTTALAKQRAVRALGGACELVDEDVDTAAHAAALATSLDACYLDQFGLASAATDWRGNNNIAQSILLQCAQRGAGDPSWIVCGAGTGGTSATIGRYLRYVGSSARLCVAEPTGAAFARAWRGEGTTDANCVPSVIEGIGRTRVEPCFAPQMAEEVLEASDVESIAACLLLERFCDRRYGGSSGTNVVAALALAQAMQARGEAGTIVLLLGDGGERYADTLFDNAWLHARGLAPLPALCALARTAGAGTWFTDRGAPTPRRSVAAL